MINKKELKTKYGILNLSAADQGEATEKDREKASQIQTAETRQARANPSTSNRVQKAEDRLLKQHICQNWESKGLYRCHAKDLSHTVKSDLTDAQVI